MSSLASFAFNNPGTCLISLFCVGAVWIYNRRASKLPNIPGPPSSSFLTGNLFDLVAPTTARDWVVNTSNTYGGAVKLSTLFGGRSLLVNDQKALHHLLVKEQDNFEEWEAWTTTNDLLFGPGLLSTAGAQHKKQRRMLTPAFSVKNLRGMTPMFMSIARELESAIASKLTTGPQEIELTSWLSRVALEAIGRGGMGVSFGKMSEPTTFSSTTKQLAAILSALLPIGTLTPFFKYLGPGRFRRWLIKLLPFPLLKSLENIVNIMEDEGTKIVTNLQRTLGEDGGIGEGEGETKDIISILLRANRSPDETEGMSNEELIAQTSTLIFTAMDTTSSAISRILHQLALHPHVQEKLRTEVSEAFRDKEDAEVDWNMLAALPYLDAVIKETLRVFPPLPVAFRQTLKDTLLPLLHPITSTSGTPLTSVLVEKGTDVFINVIGANHNPRTWGADAGEWKPERWLGELPESVSRVRDYSGVLAHQMTFMAGNRSCIGFNFALLEMRVVLSLFLQSFEFSLPKDKEIVWNLGLLMTPVLKGGSSMHGQLPLVVKKRGSSS